MSALIILDQYDDRNLYKLALLDITGHTIFLPSFFYLYVSTCLPLPLLFSRNLSSFALLTSFLHTRDCEKLKFTVQINYADKLLPFSLIGVGNWSVHEQATPLFSSQAARDWWILWAVYSRSIFDLSCARLEYGGRGGGSKRKGSTRSKEMRRKKGKRIKTRKRKKTMMITRNPPTNVTSICTHSHLSIHPHIHTNPSIHTPRFHIHHLHTTSSNIPYAASPPHPLTLPTLTSPIHVSLPYNTLPPPTYNHNTQ